MREIKFRGKRVDNGEWVYGYFAIDTDTKSNYIIERIYWNCEECSDQTLYYEVDPETIGQYIGLKDKNGKEIYEGDILRWECSKSGSNRVKNHIVTIEWDRRGYDIVIHDDGRWKTQKSYWNDANREVIGNIHDNPDLLEDDQ